MLISSPFFIPCRQLKMKKVILLIIFVSSFFTKDIYAQHDLTELTYKEEPKNVRFYPSTIHNRPIIKKDYSPVLEYGKKNGRPKRD